MTPATTLYSSLLTAHAARSQSLWFAQSLGSISSYFTSQSAK